MQSGIDPLLFWELSLGEVVDMIDAYTIRQRQDIRMQIVMLEVQAQQIAERFSSDRDVTVHRLWDYYPGFFDREKALAERSQEDEELEKLKACRRRFASEHNARFGGDA